MTDASEIALTDDLPDELKAEFQKRKRNPPKRTSKFRPIIVRLLGTHGELDAAELLTGIYNATNKEKIMTRPQLYPHISALKKSGHVKTVKGQKYALTDKAKKAFHDASKPAGSNK